jgi:hypothetical protein
MLQELHMQQIRIITNEEAVSFAMSSNLVSRAIPIYILSRF